MRGKHNQQEGFMTLVSLESLVPSDHIVRSMEKHIDFSFIDKRTERLYGNKGRPSAAPQVLIRMMLIGSTFMESLRNGAYAKRFT